MVSASRFPDNSIPYISTIQTVHKQCIFFFFKLDYYFFYYRFWQTQIMHMMIDDSWVHKQNSELPLENDHPKII